MRLECESPSLFVRTSSDCHSHRFLGSCIVLVAAVLSIWTLLFSGNIDSGLVGLVLSYAISMTGSLNWVIRSASDG